MVDWSGNLKVRWCPEKNRVLQFRYGISFWRLLHYRFICITDHHARSNQKLMLFEKDDYIWVVPFVEDKGEYFLKTFYPSRRYTRLYREGGI